MQHQNMWVQSLLSRMLNQGLRLLLILGLAGGISVGVNAQTAGRITGQVMDSSQAVIPGASVTAQNIANGQQRKATTNSQGRYVIADLPVGAYKLTVERQGFQTQARGDVRVNVATTVTIDFTLQAGQGDAGVSVTGEAFNPEAAPTDSGVP